MFFLKSLIQEPAISKIFDKIECQLLKSQFAGVYAVRPKKEF